MECPISKQQQYYGILIEHHILIRIVFIVTHYTHARSAHTPNVLFVIALEFSSKPSLYINEIANSPVISLPALTGLIHDMENIKYYSEWSEAATFSCVCERVQHGIPVCIHYRHYT